jgi:hypothetical protein
MSPIAAVGSSLIQALLTTRASPGPPSTPPPEVKGGTNGDKDDQGSGSGLLGKVLNTVA